MISPDIINDISKREGIGWMIVEKDYFLTLLIEAIADTKVLHDNLVFKGGTALRKIYFGNYRYSEDLDFTMEREMEASEIREAFESALAYLAKEHNASFRIKEFNSKRHFTDIKIQFVGLKGNKNTISIDMGPNEIIVDDVPNKSAINPYYEKKYSIKTYSLEEIAAEKLRSVLQRTRVRDYYDIWYLLTNAKLDKGKVSNIFVKKARYKNIVLNNKADLLNAEKLVQAQAYYHSQIGNQLKNPPSFEKIKRELEDAINELDIA